MLKSLDCKPYIGNTWTPNHFDMQFLTCKAKKRIETVLWFPQIAYIDWMTRFNDAHT